MWGWLSDALNAQLFKGEMGRLYKIGRDLELERDAERGRADRLQVELKAAEDRKVQAEQLMSKAYRDMRESDTRCQNYIRQCEELKGEIKHLRSTIEKERQGNAEALLDLVEQERSKWKVANEILQNRIDLQLAEICRLKDELDKRPAKKSSKPLLSMPKVIPTKRAPRKKRGAK